MMSGTRWVVLLAVATIAASACGLSGVPSGTTEIVAISYGGPTQIPHRRFLADPFEAAHDSVKVTLVASESEDVVAQIKAGRRTSPYDVIPLGEPRQATAIEEGWIEQTPLDALPNLEKVHPYFRQACRDHGVPETYSLMGLAYNPDRVPRPNAWTDLWAPEYQGQVGLTTPASNLGFAFVVLTATLFGGSETDVEPAWAQIRRLEPFVVATNPTALAQLFERNEVAVAPLWSNDAAVLASKGLNVKFVQPAQGAVILVSCLNVVRTSAHPELARDYINRAVSREYQSQAVQAPWFFGPTNMEVEIPEAAGDYLPASFDHVTTLKHLDWAAGTRIRGAVTARFNREFRR